MGLRMKGNRGEGNDENFGRRNCFRIESFFQHRETIFAVMLS
jgi:hypothetical protein